MIHRLTLLRTRKLRPTAATILGPQGPGKIARCQIYYNTNPSGAKRRRGWLFKTPNTAEATSRSGRTITRAAVDPPLTPPPNTEAREPLRKLPGPQGPGKIARCQILVQRQALDGECRGLIRLTHKSKVEGSGGQKPMLTNDNLYGGGSTAIPVSKHGS